VGRHRHDPGTLPNAELNLGDIFLALGKLRGYNSELRADQMTARPRAAVPVLRELA
jgi:hypothetical protein